MAQRLEQTQDAIAIGRAPEQNGADMPVLELAREIGRRRPELPVVLTTGYIEAARAAVTEGLEVLVKPYSLDVLDGTLRAQLARRIALAR